MVRFDRKMNFFILAKYSLHYARLICKALRNQNFFPVKKKSKILFFLILMSRIICILFCNIDWHIVYSIRLHFYYLYHI